MIIPFVKISTIPTTYFPASTSLYEPTKYVYGEVLEYYNLPSKRFLQIGEVIIVEHCLDREISPDKIGIACFLNHEKNFFLLMVEGEKEEGIDK